MVELLFVFVTAVTLDSILGDPVFSYHPVRLLGKLATVLECRFRCMNLNGIVGGAGFAMVCIAVAVGAYIVVRLGAALIHPLLGYAFDALILWLMYAHRDLVQHAYRVYRPLSENQLDDARQKVSMIVGRDTSALDESGVARAAIESVAENFVDGSLGILFWMVVLIPVATLISVNVSITCVTAAVVYRCGNTLDAMVGHRNARYENFGKFSARFDDVMNYLPARWSVVPLVVAGALTGGSVGNGVRSWRRYRSRIASINSGHPESIVAGLLNVRLGGPVHYHGSLSDHGWIWEPGREARAQDIRKCVQIANFANGFSVAVVFATAIPVILPVLL